MTNGATFPPIVLFHDGNQHYLADGFHRFMAAQRLAFKDIDADVQPGTKEDALWFALGANRTNGNASPTRTKARHRPRIADMAGYEHNEIAEQLGCSSSTYVSAVKGQVTRRL
jgi:ParB-like chromosome segregation protein Spo0J